MLIWGVILSTFLTSLVISKNNGTAGAGDLWFIFLLGIPLQVAETLWFCLRRARARQKALYGGTDGNRAFKKRGGSGQGKIFLSGGKRKRNVSSNGKSAVLYGAETGIMRGSGNG